MSRRAAILAALALFAATAAHAAAERSQVPAAPDPDGTIASGWTLSGDSAPGLTVGETTPSFSYLGIDGEWHGSQELLSGTAAVLVFGARDEQLVGLERQRAELHALGIRTIVVLDMRTGSAARLVRRLKFGGTTVVDPQCAIAELYSSLDPVTRHHDAACFVLDEHGRLRGAVRGSIPEAQRLVDFAMRSLNRPEPTTETSFDIQ